MSRRIYLLYYTLNNEERLQIFNSKETRERAILMLRNNNATNFRFKAGGRK